jgi:hypothetical protein
MGFNLPYSDWSCFKTVNTVSAYHPVSDHYDNFWFKD